MQVKAAGPVVRTSADRRGKKRKAAEASAADGEEVNNESEPDVLKASDASSTAGSRSKALTGAAPASARSAGNPAVLQLSLQACLSVRHQQQPASMLVKTQSAAALRRLRSSQLCLCRAAVVRQQSRELHSSVTHLAAGLVEAHPATAAMAPAAYLLDNLQHSLKAGLPQGIIPFGGKAVGQSGESIFWHLQLAQCNGYDMHTFQPVCSCS